MRLALVKLTTAFFITSGSICAEGDTLPIPKQSWSFEGPTGTFKRDALQRGYQAYKEVCSACHGLNRISYEKLMGIGLSKNAVKALALEHDHPDLTDDGEPTQRKGIISDKIHSPYANDKAARASNNGALPPDLSLITKARTGGPNYLYALLTGFCEAPKDTAITQGMHYNPYFSGRQISMAPPLFEGQIKYADGTKATTDQMAKDVVTFLSWAAEPEMEQRKQMGFKVLFYLLILTTVLYLSKRKIWKSVK
ncbi:MAG: cytochrome c1 [Alphaproteobacteria bacterium]|nr:cytochrome c1 [Alphaproteobacteria bacterium]